MVIWDNLNIAFRVGEQRKASKDHFDNGTTATLIPLYVYPSISSHAVTINGPSLILTTKICCQVASKSRSLKLSSSGTSRTFYLMHFQPFVIGLRTRSSLYPTSCPFPFTKPSNSPFQQCTLMSRALKVPLRS
jgi:hypothetical protein